jgi:hypothetical protein
MKQATITSKASMLVLKPPHNTRFSGVLSLAGCRGKRAYLTVCNSYSQLQLLQFNPQHLLKPTSPLIAIPLFRRNY